jgi:hypothetical protein
MCKEAKVTFNVRQEAVQNATKISTKIRTAYPPNTSLKLYRLGQVITFSHSAVNMPREGKNQNSF